MTKQETIQRLCALVTLVGEEKFNNHYAHDCFCGLNPYTTSSDCYAMEACIIEFIEQAVNEKLAKSITSK